MHCKDGFLVPIPQMDLEKIKALSATNIEMQKLIWLTSFVYKIQKDTVSSQYLKLIIGNNYSDLIELLKELAVIRVYDGYSTDGFGGGYCKTFIYTGAGADMVLFSLTNKALLGRLFRKEEVDRANLSSEQKMSQLYIEQEIELDYENARVELLAKHNKSCKCQNSYSMEQVLETQASFGKVSCIECHSLKVSLLQLVAFENQSNVSCSSLTGRTYHKINGLNSIFRKHLYERSSGERLVEVDVSQSHPFLIAKMSDDSSLIPIVMMGDLYTELKGDGSRESTKSSLFKFMNNPGNKRSPIYRAWKQNFPRSFDWIMEHYHEYGAKGYQGLSNVLSREEAKVISLAMTIHDDNNIGCVSIHDSIMSTDPDFTEKAILLAYDRLGYPFYPQVSIK